MAESSTTHTTAVSTAVTFRTTPAQSPVRCLGSGFFVFKTDPSPLFGLVKLNHEGKDLR